MAQPKRRAGESLESYNRRLVAYYKNNNRKALEDAFYNDEEDVDIRGLTKGSPKPKKSLKRNQPRNPYIYDEDRPRRSIPNRGNIWDKGEEEVDIRDLIAESPAKAPRKTAEPPAKAPRKKNKYAVTPGDYTKRIGGNKNKKPVLTPGDYTKNIGNEKFKVEDKEGAVFRKKTGRTALTPGDYTKNIGNEKYKVEDVEDFAPRTKSSRPVRTPGDYTKNIGNYKDDSGYVYDNFVVNTVLPPEDYTKNIGNRFERRAGRDAPSTETKGYGKRVLTPGDYTKNIGNYKRDRNSGNLSASRLSPTKRGSASAASTNNTEQKGNMKSVREGTVRKMESSPRQTLENGFREQEEKKQKSGSTGFRGIRP